MKSVLPFDELNRFSTDIRERYAKRRMVFEDDYEDTIDEMLDLFLLAYALGNEVTNESLSFAWSPTLDDVMDTVDAEVAGKTWRERVEEYFQNGGTAEDIIRIAETETHRIANTAALDTAVRAGATTKTWLTMLDDRVRDLHFPLEGQTIPIDADFYTYDGDHGRAPGLFSTPENNVNCRCELRFGRE